MRLIKFPAQGSGLVIVLLVVVFCAIGATGWEVYRANSRSPESTQSQLGATAATPNPATPQQKYFLIPEWGVRAPYSGKLTLEYTYHPATDVTRTYLEVTSKELKAADPTCAANEQILLSRYTADELAAAKKDAQESSQDGPFGSTFWKEVAGNTYGISEVVPECQNKGVTQAAQILLKQTYEATKAIEQNLQAIPGQ